LDVLEADEKRISRLRVKKAAPAQFGDATANRMKAAERRRRETEEGVG
jgi:hypothetical protein